MSCCMSSRLAVAGPFDWVWKKVEESSREGRPSMTAARSSPKTYRNHHRIVCLANKLLQILWGF